MRLKKQTSNHQKFKLHWKVSSDFKKQNKKPDITLWSDLMSLVSGELQSQPMGCFQLAQEAGKETNERKESTKYKKVHKDQKYYCRGYLS